MNYAFFALVRALPSWLSLTREERQSIWEGEVGPILARYPKVSIRTFDAEAFSTRCSDILLFETEDIEAYYFLIEEIRDHALCTVPYFEFVDIIPAIEEGFKAFEESKA